MGRSISHVLKDAFAAAMRDGESVQNISGQAKFLGMSPGHLSRIRNGKTWLTDEMIRRIAARFAKDDSEYEKSLQADLVRARSISAPSAASGLKSTIKQIDIPADISVEAVKHLFVRVSGPNSLVCADYRDLPQTASTGPYPYLADHAAAAIAAGCCFAMFQAFGTLEEQLKGLNNAREKGEVLVGRDYLIKLAAEVRKVYKEIAEKAATLAANREGIRGQIVLYESKKLLPIEAGGIQSRLLYADYTDQQTRKHETEAHQWVVGVGNNHYFIERDNRSIDILAVEQQFRPITAFWTKNRRLPETARQLAQAYKDHVKVRPLQFEWLIWKGKA